MTREHRMRVKGDIFPGKDLTLCCSRSFRIVVKTLAAAIVNSAPRAFMVTRIQPMAVRLALALKPAATLPKVVLCGRVRSIVFVAPAIWANCVINVVLVTMAILCPPSVGCVSPASVIPMAYGRRVVIP